MVGFSIGGGSVNKMNVVLGSLFTLRMEKVSYIDGKHQLIKSINLKENLISPVKQGK